MARPPALVWFRQDLRLTDNPALSAAVASGQPIVALYVLDERSPGARPLGGASRWWLHHSLAALSDALAARGGALVLRRGAGGEVVRELVRETGADAVYWNRCYEPFAVARDRALKAALRAEGIAAESFNGSLLAEPWEIATGRGDPYRVFTPFWRALRAHLRTMPALSAPDRLEGAPAAGERLAEWDLLPVAPDWAGGLRKAWTPGEEAASTRLSGFAGAAMARYRADRDRPDREGTSRLSPHLQWGEVGPAQVWRAAIAAVEAGGAAAEGGEALARELAWRDFNHHLLYHWPDIVGRPWKPEYEAFAWRDDPDGLRAWQAGRTGFPLVDAGMRELWHTGWMHNRVRMVAASFLVKDLLIDWRLGEAWFRDTLVDASLANNVANWQWVAGCGADAAPFFRIFNPEAQAAKFDPDGAYVRRWVPERGTADYPAPILDRRAARERALAAWRALPGRRGDDS